MVFQTELVKLTEKLENKEIQKKLPLKECDRKT